MRENVTTEKTTGTRSTRRNMVPIYILKIMKEHTDQDHHVTQEFLVEELGRSFHYKISRKALGRYLHLMMEEDWLNIYGHAGSGYYYARRSVCIVE